MADSPRKTQVWRAVMNGGTWHEVTVLITGGASSAVWGNRPFTAPDPRSLVVQIACYLGWPLSEVRGPGETTLVEHGTATAKAERFQCLQACRKVVVSPPPQATRDGDRGAAEGASACVAAIEARGR